MEEKGKKIPGKVEASTGGGKRVAPASTGAKLGIAAGVLVCVAGISYVGLCAFAAGDTLWPNTSVMGIDVSGLTVVQAQEKLAPAITGQLAQRSVTLTEPASGAKVEFSGDALAPTALSDDLARVQGEGSFLTLGGRYLASLAGAGRDVTPALDFTQEGEARLSEALSEIAHAAGTDKNETTWEIQETDVAFTKGVTGRTVDAPAVRQSVRAAFGGDTVPDTIEVPIIKAAPAEPDLDALHAQIYVAPADAYFDKESKTIVEAVIGRDFDPAAVQSALASAEEGERIIFPLTVTEPEITTADLEERLFRDVLGDAATKVKGTSDRIKSIKNAAGFINGFILLPGEEFSYNALCEPYSTSNGYGKATAYVNGLSVDTVAGGICQMSSTLHWAVLKANLEITERSSHRYEPNYISGGLDATVYGGGPDFKFVNSTEYPVKLETYMDGKNYIHATIYGTNTTGLHGQPYSTNRVVTRYAQTIYEANGSIPAGTTRADSTRTAYNGVSIETYQVLVDAQGNTVSTQFLHKDTYSYRNAVIFYNPGDAALWGIDPATGLKSLPPATPTPEAAPEPTVDPGSLDPGGVGPVLPSLPVITVEPSETPAVSEPPTLPVPSEPLPEEPQTPPAVTQEPQTGEETIPPPVEENEPMLPAL